MRVLVADSDKCGEGVKCGAGIMAYTDTAGRRNKTWDVNTANASNSSCTCTYVLYLFLD